MSSGVGPATLVVRSPRGDLKVTYGAGELLPVVEDLARALALMFDYKAILVGQSYQVVDETDTPLHPRCKLESGEYTLLVLS